MNMSQMYRRVGLDYDRVKSVLIKTGNEFCHSESKDKWSARNPTRGYCYKLAEVVSFHLKKKKIEHRVMQIKTAKSNHWFIRLADDTIVELISAKGMQYQKGVRRAFFPCRTKTGMSIGAEVIGKKMGIIR